MSPPPLHCSQICAWRTLWKWGEWRQSYGCFLLFIFISIAALDIKHVWFVAIDVYLSKFCMFRMCFHIYSWFSNLGFCCCCFVLYFFSWRKRKCRCFWLTWYVLLLILPLSLYRHICFLWVSYCKCPTWKWAFLDSLQKALSTCISFFLFCMHKQSRGTQCMIFSSWHEWVRILLLNRFLSVPVCCSMDCLLLLFFACILYRVSAFHFCFHLSLKLIKREHFGSVALLSSPFLLTFLPSFIPSFLGWL